MVLTNKEVNILSSISIKFINSAGLYYGVGLNNNKTGGDHDFSDYRQYIPGDDIRHIDWHHYAAKNILVVKEHEKPEVPGYLIYPDLSDSVICSGKNKVEMIKKTTAAICLLLLEHNINIEILCSGFRPILIKSGRYDIEYVLDVISQIEPGGRYGAGAMDSSSISQYGDRRLVFISDMLCEDGPEYLIRNLQQKISTCVLMNVFTNAELSPDIEGTHVLHDAENNSDMPTNITESALNEYREVYSQYFETLRREAAKRNWPFYSINSDLDFIDIIKQTFTDGVIYL